MYKCIASTNSNDLCVTLKVLEKANIVQNIKRICGSSIGSIFAALFAVGYSPDEMRDIVGSTNMWELCQGKYYVFSCLSMG